MLIYRIKSFFEKDTVAYVCSFALLGVFGAKILGLGIELILPQTTIFSERISPAKTDVKGSISALFKKNTTSSNENIKLKAVLKSSTASFAHFSDGKDSFFLNIGESRAGMRLDSISGDGVVVSKNGKQYKLLLEYAYFGLKKDNKNGAGTVFLSKGLLAKYSSDPSQMMEDVKLEEKNGKVFIAQLASGTFFDIAGFKTKDVVLSVNGQPVKSAFELIGIFRTLHEKSSFTTVIERDESKMEMKYEIK